MHSNDYFFVSQLERQFTKRCSGAIDWDINKLEVYGSIIINGKSYKPERLFKSKVSDIYQATKGGPNVVFSPNKEFWYANVTLPKGSWLKYWKDIIGGYGYIAFSTNVVIPSLYDKSGLWMSITPAECLSLRPGIKKASGKVMLGGLGLGYMLKAIIAKKEVTEIVLVEQSQELLNWYGYGMCTELEKLHKKKITVICDDVINHLGKTHGDNTWYICDIWRDFPNWYQFLSDEWCEAIDSTKKFWGWGVLRRQYVINMRLSRKQNEEYEMKSYA